jgi:hypothetical protein
LDLYDEVDPALASEILLEIRDTLRVSRSAVQLNIEIVRPGTFEAPREHLARAKITHGRGFYHAVHFDMHGQVGLRNGHGDKRFGFLFFEKSLADIQRMPAPAPGRRNKLLKPVQPAQVARLLRKHGVGHAILNVCESARARSGDDANIAGSLVRGGVSNVLAMTFKISRDAASLFLGAFYRELLTVRGSSLSQAVAVGRLALGKVPLRSARFEKRRELRDWFVPVLYSSGSDPVLSSPGMDELGSLNMEIRLLPQDPLANPSASASSETEAAGSNALLRNRDFGLLRFEKILCRRRVACLYGPPGVGKTAFLHYASRIY